MQSQLGSYWIIFTKNWADSALNCGHSCKTKFSCPVSNFLLEEGLAGPQITSLLLQIVYPSAEAAYGLACFGTGTEEEQVCLFMWVKLELSLVGPWQEWVESICVLLHEGATTFPSNT